MKAGMPISRATAASKAMLIASIVAFEACSTHYSAAEPALRSELLGPSQDLIRSLPGYSGDFGEHYGGYIPLKGTEKKMYFYLATSASDPATDPLVLWLNGGPGASSLLGWSEENGPFKLELVFNGEPALMPDGVKLKPNDDSWNQVANMLYIDQPVGTGLSYSKDPLDYETNDTQSQADLHQGFLQWLDLYPFFKNHSIYLTGESYAGVYLPLLAQAILRNNEASSPINLQGIMLGNPVTDNKLDNVDIFQVYTYHAVLPLSLGQQLVQGQCSVSEDDGLSYPNNPLDADFQNFSSNVQLCSQLFEKAQDLANNLGGYDLLGNYFYAQGTFEVELFNALKLNLTAAGINYTEIFAGTNVNEAGTDDRPATWFFNQADVRAAIHADALQDAGFFSLGTSRLQYTYDVLDVLPVHVELIHSGIRVLVYSGDQDGLNGGNLRSCRAVIAEWQPWYRPDPSNFGQQTAGYITQYNGLTYMTVRGAGHQVPTYKSKEALIMFSNFLTDTLNSTTQETVPLLEIPQPI